MKLNIDKNLLFDLYINQNKTRVEIAEIFNISPNQVMYLVSKYKILKSRELFSINIGKAQTGRTLSSETRDRISKSKKGTPAWNRGLTKETDIRVAQCANLNKGRRIKRTKEQRDLISKRTKEAMQKPEIRIKLRENFNNFHLDRPEVRAKLSKASRKLWSNPEYAEKCSNPRFGNKPIYNGIKFQSDTEMLFAKECDLLGIKYEYHKGSFKYKLSSDKKLHNYYPDFYLNDYNLYIEIKYKKTYLYGKNDQLDDKLNGMKLLGLRCIVIDRTDIKNLKETLSKEA